MRYIKFLFIFIPTEKKKHVHIKKVHPPVVECTMKNALAEKK